MKFINSPDFSKPDRFQKHPKFSYSISEPMSESKIRDIRNRIRKSLNIKVSYESIIFQLLKRGIGIYLDEFPNEYKWLIQKLLIEQSISIVISDRVLCMGIDLPIRTTCLVNYEDSMFTVEDYIQMSGRAGRRGYDDVGTVIILAYDKIPENIEKIVTGKPLMLESKYYLTYQTILSILQFSQHDDLMSISHLLRN